MKLYKKNTRVESAKGNFLSFNQIFFWHSQKLVEVSLKMRACTHTFSSIHIWMRWARNRIIGFHDQNFPESALLERGIDILVKLLRKLFDSFSSVAVVRPRHPAHLPSHGSLSRFRRFKRSFSAGPNFMPRMLIKCSSVSIMSPSPSMLCSRKFCCVRKERNVES